VNDSSNDRRFSAYVVAVTAVAVAAFLVSQSTHPLSASVLLLALAVLTVGAEALAVMLPAGSISLAYPLAMATVVLLGPTAGAVVTGLAALPHLRDKQRLPAELFVFNVSQSMLAALCSGWAYLGLGGRLLAGSRPGVSDLSHLVLPVLALAITGVVLNFMLVAGVYVLMRGMSLDATRQSLQWMIPTQLALGVMGFAIAEVVAAVDIPGLALFVVPLLVARQTYQRYTDLRAAYTDAVRSLVAAIEAKDPYTKGHSVRVAEVAVALAHEMGLPADKVERVEVAALLHDLGKIGISPSILSKAGNLTPAEYEEIKRHPDIGAHILGKGAFFEGIAPVVRYHHEKIDGSGYCEGLAGDSIPLEARVLAVADSYDAMTSQRPYRRALTDSEALAELRSNAGTQFDVAVVDAFVRLSGDSGAQWRSGNFDAVDGASAHD
jgi:putative nucleotidyltransferase with HDIG domain